MKKIELDSVLSVANKAFEAIKADPTGFARAVFSLAQVVVNQIQLSRTNKAQLDRIAERVKTVTPFLTAKFLDGVYSYRKDTYMVQSEFQM